MLLTSPKIKRSCEWQTWAIKKNVNYKNIFSAIPTIVIEHKHSPRLLIFFFNEDLLIPNIKELVNDFYCAVYLGIDSQCQKFKECFEIQNVTFVL